MRVGIGGISSVSMQICLRCIQNPSSIINIIIDFFFSCIIPNAEPFLSTSTSVSNFAHFKNGLEKFFFFGNVTHIFPLVAFAELFFKVGTNE